mmetsp:Transcript_35480/g.81190  ORF Transcript_35480/g.81190 Transcript_35480/m.81190 type:complete len:289 (-) Transcript_35480:248-1114(-)
MRLGEVVGVLLVGCLEELGLTPQVRGQEAVRLREGIERGLGEVALGLGVALRGGVAVLDAGHLQDLLGRRRRDDAGTARGGNEADAHRAALACELRGGRVRQADFTAPIAAPDGDEGALGGVDAAQDRHGHLLRRLHAEADVPVVVSHGDVADEAGALSGRGLLLHGHDLHDLVLQLVLHEEIGDLVLLDREGEEVDLLQRLDLAALHEPAKLCAGDPLLLPLPAALALALLALPLPLPLPLPSALARSRWPTAESSCAAPSLTTTRASSPSSGRTRTSPSGASARST